MPLANSINRNKVAHTHEVVYQLGHWFDDKIFEQCPTWDDCLAAGVFSRAQLDSFFGPEGNQHGEAEGAGGPGHYTQYVQTGIGWRIIAKMLAGTETDDAIRTALENFPMTERRRRYEAEQAEKERQADIKEAELSVRKLNDYEMYCCMVDENLTQQRMTPKLMFENVIAAIRVAEKILSEITTVHGFNALLRQSRRENSLLQKAQCPDPDNANEWRANEYERGKEAIGPGGSGLGRVFIAHFMPSGSVPTPETLQVAGDQAGQGILRWLA